MKGQFKRFVTKKNRNFQQIKTFNQRRILGI